MEKSEYKNIYNHEENHFFYISTHYLVLKLIRKYSPRLNNLQILDVGCGTGGLMNKLSSLGDVDGVDKSPEAIKYCRMRGLEVKKAGAEKLPFKDRSFDIVTCIDVIYHREIKNDIKAIKEIQRVLKQGGILIVRVPAKKFLYSAHDRHVYTARRYERSELIQKLTGAGLKVGFISYIHFPIGLISIVKILSESIIHQSKNSSIGSVNNLLNKIVTNCLIIEANIVSQNVNLPFGQGLIAVATK